jgi:2-polyprenyl-3-methyl-5-hydroxy-6-metoxy-1,4-benzoquinol methylase
VAALPGGFRPLREEIWLGLRRSALIRRMQTVSGLGPLITRLSWWLVPFYRLHLVRVQGGPAQGLLLRLNPRWSVPLWEGSYEQAVQHAMLKLLGPGKVLYDVGGGIGFFSLLAARMGATAVCFEPDETNAAFVETHVELNSLRS